MSPSCARISASVVRILGTLPVCLEGNMTRLDTLECPAELLSAPQGLTRVLVYIDQV